MLSCSDLGENSRKQNTFWLSSVSFSLSFARFGVDYFVCVCQTLELKGS